MPSAGDRIPTASFGYFVRNEIPHNWHLTKFLNETSGATKEQIMQVVDITERTFNNNIKKLRDRGIIPKEATRLSGGQERWYAIKD